jgi:hypothetical protein
MVRHIGFGDPRQVEPAPGPQTPPAAAPEPAPAPAPAPPEVERNWIRIFYQCIWFDLWLVAIYETGRPVVRALRDGAAPSTDALVFFAVCILAGIISFRRLQRRLRGKPVTAAATSR